MAVPALVEGGLNTDPLGEALEELAFDFVDISLVMLCMGLSKLETHNTRWEFGSVLWGYFGVQYILLVLTSRYLDEVVISYEYYIRIMISALVL